MIKIPHYIRSEIREAELGKRKMGKVGTTPFQEHLKYLKKFQEVGIGWKPSKKTVEKILYYERKNKTGMATLEELDEFVANSENVIYPSFIR